MKISSAITPIIALAVGLLATTPVSAVTFTISDVEMNKGETVTLLSPVSATYAFGQIILTTSIGEIDAWCIDLFHEITVGGGQSLAYSTNPFSNPISNGKWGIPGSSLFGVGGNNPVDFGIAAVLARPD